MAALMISAMFHVFKTLPEASTSMLTEFVICCGIHVQDNSNFATVDVVMEIDNSETAVIANEGDTAVEIDSSQ